MSIKFRKKPLAKVKSSLSKSQPLSEAISSIYTLGCLTDLGYNVGLTKTVFLAQMGKN